MRGSPFTLNLEIMTRLSQDEMPADQQKRSSPYSPDPAEPSGSWQLLLIPIAICVALLTYATLTF
jgi:hypothetical protein